MKRLSSSLVLALFIGGMLLAPLLHRHDVAAACGNSGNVSCVQPGVGAACPIDTDRVPSEQRASEETQHDASSCPLCHLVKAPLLTPVAPFSVASAVWSGAQVLPIPQTPDFEEPRLIPFSCGPPCA